MVGRLDWNGVKFLQSEISRKRKPGKTLGISETMN